MVGSFNIAKIPELYFGPGKRQFILKVAERYGTNILLVVGKQSFLNSEHGNSIIKLFKSGNFTIDIINISGEPTVEEIDNICCNYRQKEIDVVIAIGGGSVMDAGKAISAMLKLEDSVLNYLEGIKGAILHPGVKVPFIAVPTTAGTGSEATKNAVISKTGKEGFKRSLRHDNFVPDVAIIDPELALKCPKEVTAASGLDAFTQLLESYISTTSIAFTDALALNGMNYITKALNTAYKYENNLNARTNMAYGAYLSGITLANAGLGTIHGYASSLGGSYNIPHGVICGTMLGIVNRKNIEKLVECNGNGSILKKYADVGKLFLPEKNKPDEYYILSLADCIDEWIDELNIPMLGEYGVNPIEAIEIAAITGNKNNPVYFSKDELAEMLLKRI